MKNHLIISALLLIGAVALTGPLPAADEISSPMPAASKSGDRIISLQFENDLLLGFSDRDYTNGVRLNYVYAPKERPGLVRKALDWIPFFPKGGDRRFSLSLGQSIYTPSDITIPELIENERPYAGWLYLGFGVARESANGLDVLELDIGVVGPAAMAEQTQTFVHRYISGSDLPEGWSNQLKNEPAFALHYQHLWTMKQSREFGGAKWDFTPHVGGALGTVFTHASFGGTLRLGTDLTRDKGAPPRIQPSLPGNDMYSPGTGGDAFYLFLGSEGRLVARNMFLDGNLFRDSHSIDKKWFTGEIYLGAVLFTRRWRFAYTQVFKSDEYAGQTGTQSYGSLSVSRHF